MPLTRDLAINSRLGGRVIEWHSFRHGRTHGVCCRAFCVGLAVSGQHDNVWVHTWHATNHRPLSQNSNNYRALYRVLFPDNCIIVLKFSWGQYFTDWHQKKERISWGFNFINCQTHAILLSVNLQLARM